MEKEQEEARKASGDASTGVDAWDSLSRWRHKDKVKTQAAALVLCLNLGVDPPDSIKVSPCARLECWIDPDPQQATKSIETIAKTLQGQYERWQPRAKYKVHADPTVEDVKRLCSQARRTARVRHPHAMLPCTQIPLCHPRTADSAHDVDMTESCTVLYNGVTHAHGTVARALPLHHGRRQPGVITRYTKIYSKNLSRHT